MNKSRATESRILMFPCAGSCYAGQLSWRAVQELVIEGKGLWFGRESCIKNCSLLDQNPVRDIIVIDGCGRHCASKVIATAGYFPEFHLCLTDLAIDKNAPATDEGDDLQLAKDAIIAGCIRVTGRPPVIPCICSCR